MGAKWHRGLGTRLNLLIVFAILATSFGVTVFYIREEKDHRFRDLVDRGKIMAAMIAENGEYGVYTRDPKTLQSTLEGIGADPDIVYAAFLGRDMNLLFFWTKDASVRPYEPRSYGRSVPAADPLYREFVNSGDNLPYIDIMAPVVTLSRGEGEEALFSSEASPVVIGYVQLGLSQKGHARQIREFLFSTILVTVFLVLAGMGISILVAQRIASPIREFVAFTRTISEENLDRRTEVSGSAEIVDLSRSFNQMLGRLRASRDQVRERTEELSAVNERLSLLLGSLPVVVYTCETTEGFPPTYVSGNVEEVTGYGPERFLSEPGFWERNIHPEDAPKIFAELENILDQGAHEHEYRWRIADGSYRWYRDSTRVVRSSEGNPTHIVGIWEDITRNREEAEARALLGMAVEQAAETIMITDTGGTIRYVNPAFESISGYSRQDVLGKNPRILKSGRQEEEFYREMWDTLARGEVWTGSFVNRRKDGGLYQEIAVISPVRDPSGRIVHYVAVKRDVTAEVRLEEQLRQSQKMEAIGKLAGGIAHDFNNLLTAVTGYSDILLSRLPPGDPARKEVEGIRMAGSRAASLTRQLLAFSRKQMLELKVLDLNETISAMDGMLRRLIGEDIDLKTVTTNGLWKVRVDPGQVEQVIMNLVVNSRDAMPTGGDLTIETRNVRLDAASSRQRPGVKPGDYVMIAVSDTGCGMDPETQSRVFEPFFTTKEMGKGTGLGLSTVYGIVKQSGGNIWVYSEVGRGTTFKVYLPSVPDGPAEPERPARSERRTEGGTETLLLAEDEEIVRELVRTLLAENGYNVLEARDGREALEIADRHEGRIDLLLTDVVMPQMSGKELARRFTKRRPNARVLYMSGYTENAIVHHGVLDVGTAFLQKPFRMEALVRKIREVLDGE